MHNTTIYNNTNQTTITCNNNTAQIPQNKKVGVVIPIYNVAQYLRECLDSVINQTYKNLSVLLVNDGSTDNNESLNIAKEYVAKDSRFILIDKENGGLSSARNVGIAWFSEKYKTTLDSSHTKQNDNAINNTSHDNATNDNEGEMPILCSYYIINENPYNINRIYSNNNATQQEQETTYNANNNNIALQPQKIDYIIFLDSDDFWKPYCIEECIKHSDGVEIVWFDYKCYYDGIEKQSYDTQLQILCILQRKITMQDWIYKLYNSQQSYFSWVWQGIIEFKFLQQINLYFYDRVFAEDHLFGTLLFLQSKSVYVIPEPLHVYRVRSNSSCDFDSNYIYIPHYFEPYCNTFHNRLVTKKYHIASSWFLMLIQLIQFLKDHPSKDNKIIEQLFFRITYTIA